MDSIQLGKLQLQLGRILQQQTNYVNSLHDVEFRVFSQFGDDGIIQYLASKIDPAYRYFIEFGVEDYLESNTRFLLQNNNWSGLVMDGSKQNIQAIHNHDFFWKHDLLAVQAFITAENINVTLLQNLPTQKIGILHIDIDGNDYWVWKAIDCIDPLITIVEYNSVFGFDRPVTIPYVSDFVRTKHHYSNLFAGSSLLSLCDLADQKGYAFIGSNSAGNNAYFIKRELLDNLTPLSAEAGYVESKFRESRDKKGELTYLRSHQRLEAIRGMKVYNTRTNQLEVL